MSDVCLLLEGTYPYVAGGVSTWVYELIKRMDDVSFSIIYLGPHRLATRKMHYDIPSNVVEFRELYLFDYQLKKEKTKKTRPQDIEITLDFFAEMRKGNTSLFPEMIRIFGDPGERAISLYDLAHSWQGWELVRKLYAAEDEEISFIDYFWTWRFLFLPFFSLLRLELPPARLYHAISTGYAGALGVLAKLQHRRPFMLTEHGIYTRERKIEISKADWIYSKSAREMRVSQKPDFFREWWIGLFSFLSRLTYEWADEIITLYEGNRRIQIEEGAAPEKTRVIPNGIDFRQLKSLPRQESESRFRIGFVGRVVPIKDVKTFIKASRKIYEELKAVEIYVIGPTDEDEPYFRECQYLAEMEGLKDVIRFTGKAKMSEYYPRLNIIVLTSISEAQPIVVLEAAACGIPCVTTDVGACRELLHGRTPEDRNIGPSGEITPICDPNATAEAVIRILKDPALRKRMGAAGERRAERFYQIDDLIADYHMRYNHYTENIHLDSGAPVKKSSGKKQGERIPG